MVEGNLFYKKKTLTRLVDGRKGGLEDLDCFSREDISRLSNTCGTSTDLSYH